MANNSLGSISDAIYTARFNQALAKGSESGVFARPKGTSGPVKLAKAAAAAPKPAKASSPSTATKETKPKAAAKPKTVIPSLSCSFVPRTVADTLPDQSRRSEKGILHCCLRCSQEDGDKGRS